MLRIGTFVMGGLAGAALAVWLQRNRNMSAAAASMGHNVKKRMLGMKDDAIEKAMNMKFASSFRRIGENRDEHRSSHDDRRSAHSASSRARDEAGMEQIRNLVSQDPEVGKEVEKILNQNGHPHN